MGLSLLSNKERTSKKHASAEARRVLSLLEGRPVEERDFGREAQGRPFLPDSGLDFSISHSGAMAAVSLVRGGKFRTGCDIERIRMRQGTAEVAENFFSAPERNYIFNEKNIDETRFFGIWTLKECYLKLRGHSVFDIASVPSFISDEGSGKEQFAFGAAVPSALSFRLYELSDGTQAASGCGERYMLAVVIEGEKAPHPVIRWFSQTSLDCRMIAEIKAAPNPTETVSPKI